MWAAPEDCPQRGGGKHRAPAWGLMCCGQERRLEEEFLRRFWWKKVLYYSRGAEPVGRKTAFVFVGRD